MIVETDNGATVRYPVRPTLAQLAADIVAAFSDPNGPWIGALDGWTVETPEEGERHYVHVNHTDGRRFYINSSQHTGKLHVSGCYPKDRERYMTPRDWGALSYNETVPSINCSATRPPRIIAADIARRFLPAYTALYAACVAKQRERTDYTAAVNETAAQLAALIPGAKLIGEDTHTVEFYNAARGYGDLTPYSDSVNMNLRALSPALALKIARVIGAALRGDK